MKKAVLSLVLCGLLAACQTTTEYVTDDRPTEETIRRYRENVALKDAGEDHVTYEYKDVRVDELAPLAIRYCEDHGGRSAYLRDIILFRNHLRRATFDCVNLAKEETSPYINL